MQIEGYHPFWRRPFSNWQRIMFIYCAFLALGFSVFAMSTVTDVVGKTHNDLISRIALDQSFAEVLFENVKVQQAAISNLTKAVDATNDVVNPKENIDRIAQITSLVRSMRRDMEILNSITNETRDSVQNWRDAGERLVGKRLTLNIHPMASAYAKVWNRPPPPPEPAHKPALEEKVDKLTRLSPYLWAFISIPALALFISFGLLFASEADKVQDFAIATIIGLLGYFSGLGAGAFAVALA
ncbi:MAG: hypothetical protein PS018_16695 [bacterium]|nr:hypothetical protein [bacterium]